MPKTIFLDTNIYLHYKDLEQIHWLEIANTDIVTIIVPPVVIDELNKHKDTHPRPRVKKRAATVLKKLSKAFEHNNLAKIANNIFIQHEDRHPTTSVFTDYSLNSNIQDDQLLASILFHKAEFPDSNIILITADTGLNLRGKARRYVTSTVSLDETDKLPEEPDPTEEEVKKLRQQIQEFQHRTPNLSLRFIGRETHLKISIPTQTVLTESVIQEEMERIKSYVPKMRFRSIGEFQSDASVLAPAEYMAQPSEKELAHYNKQVEKYYADYETYLNEALLFQVIQTRSVNLELILINEGTARAEDIDIALEFPDNLNLMILNDLPEKPQAPRPPVKPASQFASSMTTIALGETYNPYISVFDELDDYPDPLAPKIDGLKLTLNINSLKQKSEYQLETLFVVFGISDNTKSFAIDYRILTATLPDFIEGKLHVIVDVESKTD